jgi:hypothetical protein
MFITALLTIAKLWKQMMPYNWLNDHEIMVYIHNGVLLSHRNNDMGFMVSGCNWRSC